MRKLSFNHRGFSTQRSLAQSLEAKQKPNSDVDILVDLDPNAKIDLFQFVGLQQLLETIMERDVDLVSRKGLRSKRHDSILQDAIEVF